MHLVIEIRVDLRYTKRALKTPFFVSQLTMSKTGIGTSKMNPSDSSSSIST